jgi:hypothetical protein
MDELTVGLTDRQTDRHTDRQTDGSADILTRESFLKGKTQYSSTPCTNQLRSVDFDISYKTSYLNEEVNRTEPSPLVSVS